MLARLTQMLASSGSLQGQAAAELDDVVGDNDNADPALHPFEPSIPAAIQSVAPLQHANAAFASGPPALPGPEPTCSPQSRSPLPKKSARFMTKAYAS
jgi:hypothetical protein